MTTTRTRFPHYEGCAAVIDGDGADGPCIISWYDAEGDTGEQCHGYICHGVLFAPWDGHGIKDEHIDEDGIPEGNWYRVSDGRDAIVGLPGSVLAVIE